MKSLLVLALFIVLADQGSKFALLHFFYYGETRVLIPEFFNLTLIFNSGGAFGLFSQSTWIFIVLSLITVVFLFIFYKKYYSNNNWIVWPFGMVLGGAVGNLIDRIRLGYVVDFLDFYVGNLHWPAFNVADTTICIGLGFLALKIGKIK